MLSLGMDVLDELRRSPRFLAWGKRPSGELDLRTAQSLERHFDASQVAELWGISTDLVRDIFRDEDGVLVIERKSTRYKRAYSTMRIPESVLERVYNRLSKR